MEIVDPQIPLNLLPPGSSAFVIAKDQPEYRQLPVVVTVNRQMISRWSPTPAERYAIANGADIYVEILAYGKINPMKVHVGQQDWSK